MIYLNNAAGSYPKAPGVADAVCRAIEDIPFHPGRASAASADVLEECRFNLAKLLSAPDKNQIVLTSGATHSLNIVLWGLALSGRLNAVTTVTEHNSVLRPLYHIKESLGGKISIIGFNEAGDLNLSEIEKLIKTKPELIVANHASNVTGRVNDIKDIFRAFKEAGAITILDASQTLGTIDVAPFDLNADIVVFTGHKGLHGPPGTGGFYISPDIELKQILVGGTGVKSSLLMHPSEMPIRYESGTPNVPAICGLLSALLWLGDNGESFRNEYKKNSLFLRKRLLEIPGVKVFGPHSEEDCIGVVSFRIEGWQVDEAGMILEKSFGIVCRTGLHCAPIIHDSIGSLPSGTIRFSVSGFTKEEEIETALNAVRSIIR